MIKNSQQLKNIQLQLDLISKTLLKLEKEKSSISEDLYLINKMALQSQYDDLKSEIDLYNSIKEGTLKKINVDSIEDLNKVLIMYRIAKGETQKSLADKLGLKVQQIQRYEAQDYQGASWHRILDIISALGIKIEFKEVIISSPEFNMTDSNVNELLLTKSERVMKNQTLLKIAV